MLYIRSMELSHLTVESVSALINISPFPPFPLPPSAPGNCCPILWFCEFDFLFLIIIGFLLEQDCPNLFCSSSIISRLLCPIHFSFSSFSSCPNFCYEMNWKSNIFICSVKFYTHTYNHTVIRKLDILQIPLQFGIFMTAIGKMLHKCTLWMFSTTGLNCQFFSGILNSFEAKRTLLHKICF